MPEEIAEDDFEEIPLLVLLAVLILVVVLMVLVADNLVELLLLTTAPTPTQYEESSQKLVKQSSETSGFHLMKSACETPYLVSTE